MSDGPLGRYPYQVMGVALLGTYLTAINTTVLGVALPSISHGLGATGRRDPGGYVVVWKSSC